MVDNLAHRPNRLIYQRNARLFVQGYTPFGVHITLGGTQMPRAYFYDLPVYRLARERYYSERDAHIDAVVYQVGTSFETLRREQERKDPNAHIGIRGHLEKKYGGCWEFNEIIGYIRLHFLGTQVRGEYFASTKKRLVRSRNRTLEWKTWNLAPEVEIEKPHDSESVLSAVRQYIAACKKELSRRVIDDEAFEVVAPHVNWSSLLQSAA